MYSTPRKKMVLQSRAVLLACVGAAAAAAGGLVSSRAGAPVGAVAAAAAPTATARSVSWWWATSMDDCSNSSAPCPEVDALVNFTKAHPTIVHTVIMRCGIVTCCRLNCGDCPQSPWNASCDTTRTNCSNNNGVGGTVVGELSPACKLAIPAMTQLGVRVELWLGEDDSITSARYLFAHPSETAAALLGVAAANPDIKGFNIDLETSKGTAEDADAFAAFLSSVTDALAKAPGGPLRFSADVACRDEASIDANPLATNCSKLGRAGRIMNMATYNAGGLREWLATFSDALTAPLDSLGMGLGCWIDSRTNGTWSITPQSAVDRVCAIMNASIQEIDMFDLAPQKNFPEPFWIPELEKFAQGGGCPFTPPPPIVCPLPSAAWRPGGGPDGCCESSANRGPSLPECNKTCAEAECAAANMTWKVENWTVHPYTCCHPPTLHALA